MSLRQAGLAIACLSCAFLGTVSASAQETAQTQPSTQAAAQPIKARVLEVRGDVKHAPVDSTDWKDCGVDDEYPQQTVIQTGVRSSCKLQIGSDDTYTAVVLDSATRTLLSELAVTGDTKRVRIGVGYGRIRAGVAEGGLKSDFVVDSPVATLSKRGTWNFGLFYERGTDRFEIFLIEQGLVDAFSKSTGVRREILPQQVVTQVMRRWLDEVQVRRNVAIPDMLGQGDMEVAFNTLQQSGLRVMDPEGGQSVLVDLSSPLAQSHFADLAQMGLRAPPMVGRLAPREGFFGTGRGDDLIPIVLEANSPLVEKGFAQPGKYKFRREVLENWLAGRGRGPGQ
jgi:hypothetical protein